MKAAAAPAFHRVVSSDVEAAAMLLGLLPEEARGRLKLIGPIDAANVKLLDGLAEQHGFFRAQGLPPAG